MSSSPAVVRTDRLTKRYATARGITDLTFSVLPGEVFGLLGPNGAGKTTLIRTLLDLLHPTAGRAELFGLDSRRDRRAIHARLGNLPGDFAADDRLTGRALLTLFARLRGVDGLGRAPELAARFRADLDRPLRELSRGNRQKVGLIQALFHDPELLILDEPTSGLDPLMQEEFLAVVDEHRARGGTALVSSHVLAEVERSCDRVGIIGDGRLLAVERVEEMRDRASREVAVRFRDGAVPPELARVAGVEDLRADGPVVRFSVRGPLDPVLAVVARHPVDDLEIRRPALEELFLGYYAAREPTT